MHFSNIVLPLGLALAAAAEPLAEPKPLPAGMSAARQFMNVEGGLSKRDTPDVDPEIICGKNYKDCGEGWCCT